MKHHIAFKFTAIVLCALSLLTAVVSGGGILFLTVYGLETAESPETVYQQSLQEEMEQAAQYIAQSYAAQTLGNCPPELAERNMLNNMNWSEIGYALMDEEGQTLASSGENREFAQTITVQVPNVQYEKLLDDTPMVLAAVPTEEERKTEENSAQEDEQAVYTVNIYGESYEVQLENGPDYVVRVNFNSSAKSDSAVWSLIFLVWQYRKWMVPATGISLLLFAALAVYLCCVAGKSVNSETVTPGGLNRIPLDLYALCAGGGIAAIVYCISGVIGRVLNQGVTASLGMVFSTLAYGGFAACLLFVGFCYGAVAQFKAPRHFWFTNSLVGRCFRGCVWLVDKTLVRGFRFLKKCMVRMFAMLPQVWQWVLVGAVLLAMLAFGVLIQSVGALLFAVIVYFCAVVYGAISFARLLDSAKRMRSGELEAKVDESVMVGGFRDFARELNSLSGVIMQAAQKQLKSERMKAELITNVSHDIKTPLTSIINYVDLLQRPHTPQEQQTYLEVLSRQSRRMKKLIDDLMELSKASTGNINVEIITLDAVEAVNQALGEFSDKLESVSLTPVFHHPQQEVMIRCDGKLFWRAISNLLGNAVKYAMPGTRLYVEVDRAGQSVLISLKNISKEQMNARGDELLERFVRGDSSRNTEGSGLGLNIAKSLLELQGGSLQLLVDGDLFKVTMILPAE